MTANNKRTAWIFGLIICLGFVGIIVAKVSGPTAPKSNPAASGTASKTQSSQAGIQGIDVVLKFGVSNDQESDLRYAINAYVTSLSQKPKSISINNVAAAPYNSEDPNARTAVTFDLHLDTTKLAGTFQYFTLTKGNVKLVDSTGAITYSSGDIDVSSGVLPS